MDVDFTPKQLANLSQVAANHGKNAAEFVKETALRAADEERLYLEATDRSRRRTGVNSLKKKKWMHGGYD